MNNKYKTNFYLFFSFCNLQMRLLLRVGILSNSFRDCTTLGLFHRFVLTSPYIFMDVTSDPLLSFPSVSV